MYSVTGKNGQVLHPLSTGVQKRPSIYNNISSARNHYRVFLLKPHWLMSLPSCFRIYLPGTFVTPFALIFCIT